VIDKLTKEIEKESRRRSDVTKERDVVIQKYQKL